ncbi:uncharacterized protein LOC128285535 [Gossypium arboreum]|uniref:uncharacterized protein LOC128285535 n=1 Tax=Gossypium arboreum TaxID=29729 RepID=UPI0022F1825C|nr:uncharacterized protein LOC128285535 [Gossypium arboreum]
MVYTYVYIDIEAELHALRLEHSAGTKTGRKRHLSALFIGHVVNNRRPNTLPQRSALRVLNMIVCRYMAHIRDTNEEERAKGITIEVGRAHFETATTRFTILDAPGHKGYIPNTINGASQAHIGEIETGYEKGGQTGEHVILAKTLGVAKLLVVVYTMDDCSVNWSKQSYDEIQSKMTPFLRSKGYNVKKGVRTIVF